MTFVVVHIGGMFCSLAAIRCPKKNKMIKPLIPFFAWWMSAALRKQRKRSIFPFDCKWHAFGQEQENPIVWELSAKK